MLLHVSRAAPRIDGECAFVRSTERTLTFRWTPATSATSYRLGGYSKAKSSARNDITVDTLTPGSYYTFTVTAIGSEGLESNSIACADSTGQTKIVLSCTNYKILHKVKTFVLQRFTPMEPEKNTIAREN